MKAHFAALAVLAALPWLAQQAAAHPYWPPRPTVKALAPKTVDGNVVCRVEVSLNLQKAPPAHTIFENSFFDTMGLNWCKAKANLPSGWDTQDDRRLRTGSMCQESAFYASLGHDQDYYQGQTGKIGPWQTPDDYSFSDGRYIFSINGWTQGSHHGGGSHTTLHLITVDVADNCPSGG